MEWDFLEGMLIALGYDRRWVNLMMLCVTSVRYSILVNGEAVGSITPTRGIRQGDPLSPYLFILCAEGLSILLRKAEARGDIHGIRIAQGHLVCLTFSSSMIAYFFSKLPKNKRKRSKNV